MELDLNRCETIEATLATIAVHSQWLDVLVNNADATDEPPSAREYSDTCVSDSWLSPSCRFAPQRFQ